jgi:hypothetical protein
MSTQHPPNEPPPVLLSVAAFCRVHSISRSFLYKLIRAGRGPPVVKLGRKTLIATEDAARWRHELPCEIPNRERKGR